METIILSSDSSEEFFTKLDKQAQFYVRLEKEIVLIRIECKFGWCNTTSSQAHWEDAKKDYCCHQWINVDLCS